MDRDKHDAPCSFRKSRSGLALLVAMAAVGFYLITEHRAHVWGLLPYLFVLACPLMHLFMHHGHQHGGHSSSSPRRSDDEQRTQ